ncbi:aldo/keto reductase [Tetragenococcus halophilus]|uniref:aldo/keto reductase n=1 Tax=Tetragenococcus halophilus TaxID=51669 RepID=UPI000CCC626E|nr:aldo/keto reductase [Tetragenococcus halophilus]
MPTVTLNNGVKMPIEGFGGYQISNRECKQVVLKALETGYRLLDTAQAYQNERAVGEAMIESDVKREDIFLTTKVDFTNSGYEQTKASLYESLEKLQVDYIDLVIMHQAYGDYYGGYRALEEFYREGKIRAIGVSNFFPDRLIDLSTFADTVPMVNQVESHVFYQQPEARKIMKQYGVQMESWGPLAEGKNNFFHHPVLLSIGEKYGKTAAQIGLRFLTQKDIVIIPKSVHAERMQENINIWDFSLTEDEMRELETLDIGKSLFFDHRAPETVEWLMDMYRYRFHK